MPTMIEVEGLGKRYRLGGQNKVYSDLRESIVRAVTAPLRKRRAGPSGEFWALRDVSFSVEEGEVVGVIGPNGAGKSTLLKILSRITRPTEGRARLFGRVGSLLEVGTGFHPELTGRENVFFSGAVLGMRRDEVRAKFDEIVDFAGVEKFLDTPVKHYSSGMRVRLGFAVAAHLEPEILLVDEVLAVGDAAFQKKCLGKMDEASKGGRTVIFVSHNMAAVESLCGHCLLLEEGHIRAMGSAEGIVQEHLASMTDRTSVPLHERKDRTGNGALRFTGLRLLDERGKEIPGLRTGSLARIEASYDQFECSSDGNRLVISLGIQTYFSQSLLLCRNDYTGDELASAPGSHRVVCEIPRFPLLPGRYLINVYAEERGEILDWVRSAMNLEVSDGDFFGTGLLPPKGYGAVLVGHRWLREN